jgi:hypothetical protein
MNHGGTLTQGGKSLARDPHGYYEAFLDAGSFSWKPHGACVFAGKTGRAKTGYSRRRILSVSILPHQLALNCALSLTGS